MSETKPDFKEAVEKWLRDNDWDYQKYGDHREDRSAYDTLMNYEISGYLADAYEDGASHGYEKGREDERCETAEYKKRWENTLQDKATSDQRAEKAEARVAELEKALKAECYCTDASTAPSVCDPCQALTALDSWCGGKSKT